MARLIAGLLLLLSISANCFSSEVGWIISVDRDRRNVTLHREGKDIAIPEYCGLNPGDVISVKKGSGAVAHVSFIDGRSLVVDDRGPLIVAPPGRAPPMFANLMRWVFKAAFEKSPPQLVAASSRAMDSRQGISIPLVRKNTTLAAGDRVLYLAWNSGSQPYVVSLTDSKSGRVVAQQSDLSSSHASLPAHLTPGVYVLAVSDARETVRRQVIVVEKYVVPAPPEELSTLPDESRDILIPVWLSARGNGKWMWEAYLQLHEHGSTPVGDLIVGLLEKGEVPRD